MHQTVCGMMSCTLFYMVIALVQWQAGVMLFSSVHGARRTHVLLGQYENEYVTRCPPVVQYAHI